LQQNTEYRHELVAGVLDSVICDAGYSLGFQKWTATEQEQYASSNNHFMTYTGFSLIVIFLATCCMTVSFVENYSELTGKIL